MSSRGLDFIARHEALPNGQPALTVYEDIYGNPTIGYGHLLRAGEHFSVGITRDKARSILTQDVKDAVSFVNTHSKSRLSQSQFDSLVSVAFNSRRAALKLLNKINSGQKITRAEFVNALPMGSGSPKGLVNRRRDEALLYSTGDYGGSH